MVFLTCNLVMGDIITDSPQSPVKLIFIHHSVGEAWLSDDNGGLAKALGQNNYFVSDTYYGWGPDGIGDRTDIPDWLLWFSYPENTMITHALYTESNDDAAGYDYYNRPVSDPGGENEVIIFKSCFPNSNLEGNPDDSPGTEPSMTVSGAKYVYNQILQYFASHPEKLFIAITPPPDSDPATSQNARSFSEWMVKDWLRGYQGTNVGVFDLHAVLSDSNNHHQVTNGEIEHVNTHGDGTCAYPTGDAHPDKQGNLKATSEFVPLLSMYYNRWAETKSAIPANTPSQDLSPLPSLTPEGSGQSVTGDTPTISPPSVNVPKVETVEDVTGEMREGGWVFYSDGVSVIRQVDSNVAVSESDGVCVDVSVIPEGWASAERLFEIPADWSSYQGISFKAVADNPESEFRIAVYSGAGHEEKIGYYADIPGISGKDGDIVTIPFSDLMSEDGTSTFDKTSVVGYYFAFGESLSGTWCFDSISPK